MKKQISTSSDYDKFKFLPHNRSVAKGAVKKIADSINEIGYITSFPILVNKEFFIIDGQHRFEACKLLKIPVHYMVASKNGRGLDTDKVMLNLNAKMRGQWQSSEYVKHFAHIGKSKFHKELLEFDERFKFGTNLSMDMLLGHSAGSKEREEFREGKDFPIWKHADACAVYLEKIKAFYPYALKANFYRAVLKAFHHLSNHQKDKLLRGIPALPQQASSAAYLACFENIINKGLQNDDKRICLTK